MFTGTTSCSRSTLFRVETTQVGKSRLYYPQIVFEARFVIRNVIGVTSHSPGCPNGPHNEINLLLEEIVLILDSYANTKVF